MFILFGTRLSQYHMFLVFIGPFEDLELRLEKIEARKVRVATKVRNDSCIFLSLFKYT